MDIDEFWDGLLSISFLIIIFSFAIIVISLNFNEIFSIDSGALEQIFILCLLDFPLSFYFIVESLRIKKFVNSEDHYIVNFGRRIGIVALIFIPHIIYFISLIIGELNGILKIACALLVFFELVLIGLIGKEIYDLFILKERRSYYNRNKNYRKI